MNTLWNNYKQRISRNCMGELQPSDGVHYWRNRLFSAIIIYLLPLGLIILLPSALVVYTLELPSLVFAYIFFGFAISFISLQSGIDIKYRKYLFLTLIYFVAATLIFFMGEFGAGLTYLFGITVFALLILPAGAGVWTIFINIGLCLVQALFIHLQVVDYPLRESYQVASWIAISANSILLSIVAVIFMPMLFKGLQETIEYQYSLEKKLTNHKNQLERSLKEKETLLAEIHHRVKNNLAVISGMLQLQSFKETDVQLSRKLLDSTLRIKSMANIHEQLYRSKSFSEMSFDSGLESLVEAILETMDSKNGINPVYSLSPVKLNITQAVPCCLIVNEVVTNSVKHAFKSTENGIIEIYLAQENSQVHLEIKDNGKGVPENLADNTEGSLGIELISTLSEQLKAEFSYLPRKNQPGTIFSLHFSIKNLSGHNGA